MTTSKKVLVTGASKGIGSAIALQLGQQGFDVTVHYNSDEKGALAVKSSIEEKNGKADIIQFNISDRQACKQQLEEYIEQNGAFYGVVCNAGITRDTAFPAMEDSLLSIGLLTVAQIENRKILRNVMTKAGFSTISSEWWHFNAYSYQDIQTKYNIIE